MVIDYNEIREQSLENFKGGEKTFNVKMFTDDNNKIMRGRLESGASIGLHTHDGNSEIILILEGRGKVLYDGEYISLKVGDVHYCPMGHSHSLINGSDSDLKFFAVVGEH